MIAKIKNKYLRRAVLVTFAIPILLLLGFLSFLITIVDESKHVGEIWRLP